VALTMLVVDILCLAGKQKFERWKIQKSSERHKGGISSTRTQSKPSTKYQEK